MCTDSPVLSRIPRTRRIPCILCTPKRAAPEDATRFDPDGDQMRCRASERRGMTYTRTVRTMSPTYAATKP